MKKEVDAGQTKRAEAFALWMRAPMPMITLFKSLDVTNPVRLSRRRGLKFNMLLCWCIGRAASRIEEFYLLPVDGGLMRYDSLAVSVVTATRDGGITTCDVPFSEDLPQFNQDYLSLTGRARDTCRPHSLDDDRMVIGTSALAQYDIDGAVNIYAGIYNNPFMVWGKYRRGVLRAKLPVSFQFHHTQMDGAHAAQFLDRLQMEITNLKA